MEDLGKFVKKLRPTDEVAVEITGNTRLFHDAVAPQVARVVVVKTNQFRVIRQSEEDGPQRRADAGVVLVEKHAAGGADEG